MKIVTCISKKQPALIALSECNAKTEKPLPELIQQMLILRKKWCLFWSENYAEYLKKKNKWIIFQLLFQ